MTKRNRRDYRTGSVYQRASDGLWIGTIEAGYTKSGGRRRITVSGKTEAEAKRKLRDRRLQLEREGLPSVSARATVKKYAETWLEDRKTKIRPKPYATDASAIRQWIVPVLGHKRLDELTPADIRAVGQAQRKAGRSSSTARRTHTTLTSMLRDAMIEGHQVPARVLLVDPPAIAINDRDAMPIAETLLVLAAAHELLPHWSLWMMQALHGMRPAEVLGVTEDAIDLGAGTLVVEWQLQPLPYNVARDRSSGFRIPDGYEARRLIDSFHLVRPKTKKGFRVIPLVPAMRDALAEWLPQRPPNPWGLVWPAADGRPATEKDNLAEWYALQDTVGVRHPTRLDKKTGEPAHYYIYELRHGFATRLMEERADETVITAIMGHSSIVTSRGYMHASQAQALEAMQRQAELLALPQVVPGEVTGSE